MNYVLRRFTERDYWEAKRMLPIMGSKIKNSALKEFRVIRVK